MLEVSGSSGQLAGLGTSEAAGVLSYQRSDLQAFHMSTLHKDKCLEEVGRKVSTRKLEYGLRNSFLTIFCNLMLLSSCFCRCISIGCSFYWSLG